MILDSVPTPKPMINSEIKLNESCTPTYQLQNSFRDQGLIRKGQRVKSGQSRVHETENLVFVLRKFLSVEPNPNSDLWALFEHVVHIFITWFLNKVCSL